MIKSFNFAKVSDVDLLVLRLKLDAEIRKRKLAFSVGDAGERLVIEYFKNTAGLTKLQLAPRGTKNVDALSRDGERYSIKSILRAKKTGTIYPERGDRDRQLFEYLLIVQLDDSWALKSIHQLTWKTFCDVRSWDTRMNAWYVAITGRALSHAARIFPVQESAGV